jgi:ribonuclease P protein component
VKRRFRLTRSTDFKRVRRSGKSYAHSLIVLYAIRSDRPETRVGVTAGITVGNAVKRNRAKRLMREAMRSLLPVTVPGFDLMLIARSPLAEATLEQTQTALTSLLQRAGLLVPAHDD